MLVVTPGSGTGSLRIPRLSARVAGGEVRGDLLFRLGDDQSFNANLQLASLELETLTRIASEYEATRLGADHRPGHAGRPEPGRA